MSIQIALGSIAARFRSRVRLIVVTLFSLVLLLAVSGVAYACNGTYQSGYWSVPGYTWLQQGYTREYDDNNTYINASWAVCEKLIAPNTNPELRYSYNCATNGFAYGFSNDLGRAPYPNCNTLMWALMLNDEASSATFHFYQHY